MGRILVTGGNGLVGRCFEGDKFIKVSSSEYDLTDPSQVRKMFFDIKPESVIHCAAKVGGLKANMTQKGDFFYQNIMMNTNVIEEAKNNQVEKLVCFLSTCVFPDDVEYPLSPEKIHLGKPHFSNDAYAYAKRMADVQIQAYREQYGLNYFSVVPTNIYGPGDNYSLENGHVVPTLIHKFYLAKKNNQDVRIWGSGSPLREFIYSKDVAALTENLLKSYTGKDPVILSTSQEYSIKELASLIGELMEFEGDVIYESDKPDGQMRKPSDNSFVKSNFPDFHFTSLRLGLRRSIDWFIDHYPNTRK
jgi:GDP-L-fucose synthase